MASKKKGFLDRYDGWRVRDVDAVFAVVPFVLRTRIDSQCMFEENIPIEKIESFIREHKEDMPDLTFMHVIMAALVRLVSQKPYLNRFVIWNKLYAHNNFVISLAIKRQNGVESIVKPEFELDDTIYDVTSKLAKLLNENLDVETTNEVDSTADILGKLPSFVLRPLVWLLFQMDKVGLLPKFLNAISPWHCSMFLTNVGSLGIGPIYHHLYEFGTCSCFIAMGNKMRVQTLNQDGTSSVRRYLGLKFVADERICDGMYFASAMKVFKRILTNPECLLQKPEEVIMDDGVRHFTKNK
ncbi:MAG: branched-chain alpha-keto acid dehydrogenase subunit E2 [Firmicutes bacterium ADurb.Bin182]|nr:MAG: branched-chain alpha-keto acid dehydrogenase subunit E2 [Firmicutes bacterium ADurb.Bin182]